MTATKEEQGLTETAEVTTGTRGMPHYHEVWKRVAAAAGMTYTKEEL